MAVLRFQTFRRPPREPSCPAAVCLYSVIEYYGKQPALFTLRHEIIRQGENLLSIKNILEQYGLGGDIVKTPVTDLSKVKTPAIISTTQGFKVLVSTTGRYRVADSNGFAYMDYKTIGNIYTGETLSVVPLPGYNLAGEDYFDLKKSVSRGFAKNKAAIIATGIAFIISTMLTAGFFAGIRAFVDDVLTMGAVNILPGIILLLSSIALMLCFIRFALSKIRSDARNEVAQNVLSSLSIRSNELDAAIYAESTRHEMLRAASAHARNTVNTVSNNLSGIWRIASVVIFTVLCGMINIFGAIPAAAILIAFVAIFVMRALDVGGKKQLQSVYIMSFAAVISSICLSAFLISLNAISTGEAVMQTAYTAAACVSACVYAYKENRSDIREDVIFVNSFMNFTAYPPCGENKGASEIRFENVTVYATNTVLASSLTFTIKKNGITLLEGNNTNSVLKAISARDHECTGKRLYDGQPYELMGRRVIADTVYVDDCNLRKGSILENLRGFDDSVAIKDIFAAARQTGLTEPVMTYLGSFDFKASDNGANVSSSIRSLVRLTQLLILKPSIACINKQAVALDDEMTDKVFDVLTKAGITVVTDRQCKADSVINVNGKGGKQ